MTASTTTCAPYNIYEYTWSAKISAIHTYNTLYQYICIYTYTHTCMYTCMLTCIHEYIHAYMYACMYEAWWLISRFDEFRSKGSRFESRSSRHVRTLGKSFTRS